MTNALQVSGKKHSGEIYVVGGSNFDDFYQNLLGLYQGDVTSVDALVSDVRSTLLPISAGSAAPPFTPNVTPQQYQQPANVEQAVQNLQAAGMQPTPVVPGVIVPNGQYQSQPRPAAAAPPGQQAPLCEHGHPREFKSGTSAGGKDWKAWMCPLPKGSSCSPQWIR